MKWLIVDSDDCPVLQIVPTDGQPHLGHIACPCQPCLDGSWGLTLLVHHTIVDGRPTKCREIGAHTCARSFDPLPMPL